MWEGDIVPALKEYIEIPCLSPGFDAAWAETGHLNRAAQMLTLWLFSTGQIQDRKVTVEQLPGLTPLICVEIPAFGETPPPGTVLLYGHLDKQPEMTGWREGLSAWTAVRDGDRLYGRGGADDGYAVFAAMTAIQTLQNQGVPHARCVILIEASEESGSPDLPAYVEHLAERIGTPDLVICLDSGCADYDHLWLTTSLRGVVMADLTVQILTEGMHSGSAGGIVPSSFRILRSILSRIENPDNGQVMLGKLFTTIPDGRKAEAVATGRTLGAKIYNHFPWVEGAHPDTPDNFGRVLLRNTWEPSLAVTGAAGLPALANAGNVLRAATTMRLSMRIPPMVDPEAAFSEMQLYLERQPPYGARVSLTRLHAVTGWNAPPTAPWLEQALSRASREYFDHPYMAMGEGGTIPFMAMLGERFPDAQFVITGVLGPESNAHGPNEFLHLPMAKRLTCAIASIVADHATKHG
jgi:acetylornithine deacetylase/succinyl-diaminopimelate desuccinylase-like protein